MILDCALGTCPDLASLCAYPIGPLIGVLLAILVIYGLAACGEEDFRV